MGQWPGLNFQLGEDVDTLREAVHAFAQAEIAPRAAQIDRSDQFPMDLWCAEKATSMAAQGGKSMEAMGISMTIRWSGCGEMRNSMRLAQAPAKFGACELAVNCLPQRVHRTWAALQVRCAVC